MVARYSQKWALRAVLGTATAMASVDDRNGPRCEHALASASLDYFHLSATAACSRLRSSAS
jgi:hypothetical protein